MIALNKLRLRVFEIASLFDQYLVH